MRKTNLQKLAETDLGQLEIFCRMCHYAKTNGAFGGNGITKQDLLDKGITETTFKWLVAQHYCNMQKPGRPLWIAINGNKLYPHQTVQNLEKLIKAEKEKLNNKGE